MCLSIRRTPRRAKTWHFDLPGLRFWQVATVVVCATRLEGSQATEARLSLE